VENVDETGIIPPVGWSPMLNPIFTERIAFTSRKVCGKRWEKKRPLFHGQWRGKTTFPPLGMVKRGPPDLGGTTRAKTRTIGRFSTARIVSPQFTGTYPQFWGYPSVSRPVLHPQMWTISGGFPPPRMGQDRPLSADMASSISSVASRKRSSA